MPKMARESAESVLQAIASDIKQHYYDPKFHGLDWDAVVADTQRKVDGSASFDLAILQIAAAVDTLNDSHSVFLPPRIMINPPNVYVTNWRSLAMLSKVRHDYGWDYEMVGKQGFVTHVRPGSDAEKKGLHAGDEILSINGYRPERATIQRANYVFNVLRPQPELTLELVDPDGVKRSVTVAAKVQQVPIMSQFERSARTIQAYEERERLFQPRVQQFGDELAIIKIPTFAVQPDLVEGLLHKVRKHKALIIDLRDDHGGAEETLLRSLGSVFNHEVKLGDRVMRSDRKPLVAKPRNEAFPGKLIVLVNSESMSAAELFSRVVQIEKRGLVLGDNSAGRVMEARFYQHELSGRVIFYGVSVTEADLVMADGKSLEHMGVTPDEMMTPSSSAMAKGWDPVLAYAAEKLGVKLTSEEAGKLFPYEWPPE
jgi:carboxyl-terminal processing protease